MNLADLRRPWIVFAFALAVTASFVAGRSLLAQATDTEEEVIVVEDGGEATVPAGEIKTVAVIALSSYSNLVSDIGFLGSLAGKPEAGQMIDGSIALFTQGKGLAGIDKTKPWGVILQTNGQQLLPVACIPVTDLAQTLQIVQGFNLPIQDGGDGSKQIALPNGQMIHIKENNGWAYVANSPASFSILPDDPQKVLAALVDQYDIGARVTVQNVPEMYRQQAIAAMKGGMEQGLERKEGEDDETYESRKKMAEVQMEQFERMVNEIDEMIVGLGVDAQQQRSFADFTYTFQPGSKLAKQVTSYGKPTTNFAGFFQPEAAITGNFASKADPEVMQENMEQMRSMMTTMRKQAEKAIDEEEDIPDDATRDAIKSAMGDMIDALEATMEAGEMDGGAAIEMQPDSFTAVAGALVKEPAKFESGLKKLASIAEKEPEFAGVQWNAATHEGINFHTLVVPVPESEPEARKMFGEKVDVAFGIGPEQVYFAAGKDYLDAAKRAIDASKADAGKEIPQFEFSMSLGPIMAVAAATAKEEDRASAQAIADMLANEAQGRDHIRATANLIENGIKYRFEAEEGVLRAVGKAAMIAQEKAQQEAMQMQGGGQ